MIRGMLVKKGLAIVLGAAMVFGMVPGNVGRTVYAVESGVEQSEEGSQTVTYDQEYNIADDSVTIDKDGTYRIYSTDANAPVTNTITVGKDISATITLENVNIDVSGTKGSCAFKIENESAGKVTVKLIGDNTLKSGEECAGLQKRSAKDCEGTLIIEGSGKLTAIGGDFAAGIGGDGAMKESVNTSNITIESGTIIATGGQQGAGIGGGDGTDGGGTGNGHNITIEGGTVVATGGNKGNGAAGIGGGSFGDGSNITILGGNVTAISPQYGAGIGGGVEGNGSDITILRGTVSATSLFGGAGIGGGALKNGSNITISGGTVTATGGDSNDYYDAGAGIGGGYYGTGVDIMIIGGSVKVTPGKANSSYPNEAHAIGGGGGQPAVIPTNGTDPVYLLEIENPTASEIQVNGESYTPISHGEEAKIYAYLPAGAKAAPNMVTVGDTTTAYWYDDTDAENAKWNTLKVAAVPAADETTYTYNGEKQTYRIAESNLYTVTGNVQKEAGEYTVTVSLNDKENTVWSDGTTADRIYSFVINQAELTVSGVEAEGRPYDSTSDKVNITAVTLDGVIAGEDVSVDMAGLQGTLSSVNAGSYKDIILPKLALTGKDVSNYTLVQPESAVTLADAVTISKLDTQLTVGADVYNKVYGDAAFLLDAAANITGADIVYDITSGADVVSVENGTVTIKKAGTATIQLYIEESQNYNASENKAITINVAKAEAAPDMPEITLSPEHKTSRVGDIALPKGWSWLDSDKDILLADGVTVTATAVYMGTDKGNYETESVRISITRSACDHKYTYVKEVPATCVKDGVKAYYVCDICGDIFEDKEGKTELENPVVIPKTGHAYKTVLVKATKAKDGSIVKQCSNCNTEAGRTVIYKPKSVGLSSVTFEYDGKLHKPSVEIKDSKGRVIADSYYDVTYDKGCKTIGKYKVKIVLKGRYSGTIERYYSIIPAAAKISRLDNLAGGIRITWGRKSYDGYLIYRSDNGKAAKLVKTVKGAANTSWIDTGAKTNGCRYSYAVCPYKIVNGTIYKSSQKEVKRTVYLASGKFVSAANPAAGKINVKWTKNNAATGYQIQYSKNKSFKSAVTGTYRSNKIVTSSYAKCRKGETYYVRIRAYRKTTSISYGAWSPVKMIKISK